MYTQIRPWVVPWPRVTEREVHSGDWTIPSKQHFRFCSLKAESVTAQHWAVIKENSTYQRNKSCALVQEQHVQCHIFTEMSQSSFALKRHQPSRLTDSVGNWTESTELWGIYDLILTKKGGRCVYKLLVALMQKSSRYWSEPSLEISLYSPRDYQVFWWSSNCA